MPRRIISAVKPFIPIDRRQRFEETLNHYNPFQQVRANHVLTRGVRLAWTDAMREVQKDVSSRLSHGALQKSDSLDRFQALIDDLIVKVGTNAADRDPTVTLAQYDCLDSYTVVVLEKLPEHLRYNKYATPDDISRARFLDALVGLTGWALSEVPKVYQEVGKRTFQKENGVVRGFEQLLLDAFSLRMSNQSDRSLALSFQTSQQDIAQEYLGLILAEVKDLRSNLREDIVVAAANPFREMGDRIDRLFRLFVDENKLSMDMSVAPDFGCFVQPFHLQDLRGDETTGLETLHYQRRYDDLFGRSQVLEDLLGNFLGGVIDGTTEDLFRWTLIYGDAGTGKNRLALDLLLKAEELYRTAFDGVEPDFFGFIDRDHSCDEDGIRLDTIKNWTPGSPSILVIDYAGSLPKLTKAISELDACARRGKQPIRLILLDRKTTGTLSELTLRTDSTQAHVATRFETSVQAYRSSAGIRLDGLSSQDAIELIRNRLGDRSEEFSNTYLMDRLESIRPDSDINENRLDTFRPLFAAMVGEFLSARSSTDDTQDDEKLKVLDDREKILDQIIIRERLHFWKRRAEDLCAVERDVTVLLERHENLLAMSTFCRGLPLMSVQELSSNSSTPLPADDFETSLFDVMATGMRRGRDRGSPREMGTRRLGFVEPDLIGEWFVLSLLSFPDPDGQDRHLSQGRRLLDPQGFIDLCWEEGDDRLVQFVLRCYQNHPDRVQELDYLLPSPGKQIVKAVSLIRRIFDEWRIEFDAACKDEQGLPQVGLEQPSIAEWASRLFDITREHIKGQDLTNVAEDLLVITAHHVHFSTWLSSKQVRARETGGGVSTTAGVTRRRKRSILERSKQIIKVRLGRRALIHGDSAESEASNAFFAAAEARVLEDVDDGSEVVTRSIITEEADPVSTFHEKAQRNFRARSPAAQLRAALTEETRQLPDNSVAVLAAKLMKDAASFFRSLADQNDTLRQQMVENATVYDQVSDLVLTDPTGALSEGDGSSASHVNLASRLLADAADFFDALGEANEPLAEQMMENATVFREMVRLLEKDPFEVLG